MFYFVFIGGEGVVNRGKWGYLLLGRSGGELGIKVVIRMGGWEYL